MRVHVKPEKINSDVNPSQPVGWRRRIKDFVIRIKKLQGDPHYIAMGMAIGVFVAITPTIPFHTAIALGLAIVLKGSKPAAVIGVWFSNPITIPTFYYGCYKIGMLILGDAAPHDIAFDTIQELLELGWEITLAMLLGGLILGIPPAIVTYFITLHAFQKIRVKARERKKRRVQSKSADAGGGNAIKGEIRRGEQKT